ncbi:MAG TPA: hypothetical protein VFA52_03155 [Candidatus Paceibacterota bacterium]|nr:hypothetical protein [Candidatus Paceibacterota bacterium]
MKKSVKISNTLELVLGATLLVLLMAAAYYYFFNNLKKYVQQSSALANDVASLQAEDQNLDSLRSTFSNASGDESKINSYFVQSDGAVDFINTIERLAAFAHLDGKTESVSTMEMNPSSANYELLHLTFHSSGSWQNTFYFLAMLETLPFNIRINQVNLHSTGDTTTAAVPTSNIDLSASSSSSTPKTVLRRASVWEAEYDFNVVKIK